MSRFSGGKTVPTICLLKRLLTCLLKLGRCHRFVCNLLQLCRTFGYIFLQLGYSLATKSLQKTCEMKRKVCETQRHFFLRFQTAILIVFTVTLPISCRSEFYSYPVYPQILFCFKSPHFFWAAKPTNVRFNKYSGVTLISCLDISLVVLIPTHAEKRRSS